MNLLTVIPLGYLFARFIGFVQISEMKRPQNQLKKFCSVAQLQENNRNEFDPKINASSAPLLFDANKLPI